MRLNRIRMRTVAAAMVVVVCTVIGGYQAGAGGEAGAAPVASQLRELSAILDGLERQVAAWEAALPKATGQAHGEIRNGVGAALSQLDFLSRECAVAMAQQPEYRARLAALQARLEALHAKMKESAQDVPAPASSIPIRARAMLGVRPAAVMVAEPSRAGTDQAMCVQSPGVMASIAVPADLELPYWSPGLTPLEPFNREAYAHLDENPFIAVADDPLSTFSIDVDTASYSNLRRMLSEGLRQIPKGAVRIEELVNYFTYNYRQPGPEHPLTFDAEVTGCPWTPAHRLARVALQARSIPQSERKPSNLVFLIDSSGSMSSADKIGLLKEAYKLLVDNLDDRDTVAIVTYAGSAGLVLPATTANNRLTLKFAVEQLNAGGSTAGGAGIKLAYNVARESFIKGGNNRVILATDGDFNVGVSSESELVDLITEEAKSDVFLTVLGFGTGNYQDARMESLADHGNGNYAYIDGMGEARKVFLTDLMGTLYTVAKDVKFQIEFNPSVVGSYRLIGYENRQLADRDFADDRKDAGEVGSGHQVTALYELAPVGSDTNAPMVAKLRYQTERERVEHAELMQINVRYKLPDGDTSTEMVTQVPLPVGWQEGPEFAAASDDTRFAAAVAAFGMCMRGSAFTGKADLDWVYQAATRALGQDPGGYRSGFTELVRQARELKVTPSPPMPGPDPADPLQPVR
ncbi:MAG: von Willebrand factor type A domain-containing protein [Lentisphaerae bacterium]|nr:von Willebrand factor type A domain-containing protein [Lentisphaerota bacterium]